VRGVPVLVVPVEELILVVDADMADLTEFLDASSVPALAPDDEPTFSWDAVGVCVCLPRIRPKVSSNISSSSSLIWFSAPCARWLASLERRSSRETGSPVEERSRENRRERLDK